MMKKKIPPNKHRPLMREEHFPLKNETFTQAKESLLSFVFVREPFARIVSAYNDKMVRDWSKPVFDLRWMRDEIMEKYRKNAGPKAAPTPEEFVRYIVDKSKEVGPYYLDNHIKPIWASCPFCSVDFDVIGKLEEFDKDSLFIHANMNLIVSCFIIFVST